MKKKKNRDFEEIDILKKKYLKMIDDQETAVRSAFVGLRDNITGVTLLNQVKNSLFGGPGLAFRLGFMTVSMLRERLKKRSKRKS